MTAAWCQLRLFRSADLAKQATLGGIQRLVEIALGKELAWVQKDLRALTAFEPADRQSLFAWRIAGDGV